MNSYFGKHLHMSLLLSTQLLHFNPDNFESLFLILGSKERLDLVCKTLILSYSCKDFPDAFCRRSLSALFFFPCLLQYFVEWKKFNITVGSESEPELDSSQHLPFLQEVEAARSLHF